MLEEKFAHGSSFLHRGDPRAKVIIAFLFSATTAILDSFSLLVPSLMVSLILLRLSGLPPYPVFKRMVLVNTFTLFIWITLPLTYGGETVYSPAGFSLSQEGVKLAALITIKTNTIVTILISLLATSTIADIGHALNRLKLPTKLIFILLYSYRYVFVIYNEYQRLLRAATLRSFAPRTTIHTYKTFAYLFGMTLVNSYNRSQRVYQAMQLRGFTGQLVSLTSHTFSRVDILFFAIMLFFNLLVILSALFIKPI